MAFPGGNPSVGTITAIGPYTPPPVAGSLRESNQWRQGSERALQGLEVKPPLSLFFRSREKYFS